MPHEFDADLLTEEVTVNFRGKKTTYIVTELSSYDRDRAMQKRADALEKDEDGKPKETMIDQQADMIVASLKRKEDLVAPDIGDVRMWGTRCCTGLAKVIERLNGMNKEGQEEAKKD